MAQITEALTAALKIGAVDYVKNWLNNGGNLEARFLGCTPLLLCTHERGHIHADVIRLLLDQGANINVQDFTGRSPLHWVVRHCDESPSHLEIIRWLLDGGANVNLQDKDGETPLYLAVENRSAVTATLLMDNGAIVDVQNKIGWAPLHCVMGKFDETPNDSEVIQLLVDRGADLDLQDDNGNTPLYLALWRRRNIPAKLLMDMGANVNVRNKIGWSPLHCVVGHNDSSPSNLQIIRLLLYAGADIDTQNEMGKTPLYLAAQNKNSFISILLLSMGADANIQNKMGWSPLHYVMGNYEISPNCVKFVHSLLVAGANINLQDNNGKTALLLALEKGITAPQITYLLGVDATHDLWEKYSFFPLHYVVNNSNWNDLNVLAAVAKSLIDIGVDVNMQDNDGNTPIHLAVMRKNSAVVRLLIDSGANINLQNDLGQSPLHYVLHFFNSSLQFSSHVEDIKFLIEKGADVNMVDHDGNTPLHVFLMSIHVAEHPLAYRADQSVISDMQSKINNIITLLLDNGANVNISNYDGVSLLHYAAFKDSTYGLNITKSIISQTTDVNVQNSSGQSPLHWCIYPNHVNSECLSTLLDWGGAMDVEDNDGKLPLHYLSQKQDTELMVNTILITKCLMQYMQRIPWAGLVNDVVVPKISVANNALYQSSLQKELEQMKEEKVGSNTMYQVFARYQDPSYVQNSDLNDAVNDNKYLLYGQLLKSTFAKAKRRKVLLDTALNYFNIPIPVETRRMILSYLDSSDILSLVTSYEQAQD